MKINIKTSLSKVLFTLAACNLFAGDINSLLWQGKFEDAKQLILEEPGLIRQEDEHGITPAHIAAQKGEIEFLTFLAEQGADLQHQDKYERPVICKAIMGNHPKSVAYLLKKGAKLDWVDEDGTTPLLYASYKGNPEMVKLLLGQVDSETVNKSNKWEWTPLMHLARNGYVKSAMMLLNKGADASIVNFSGNSALLFACKGGVLELVEPLLKAGADVNAVDSEYDRTAFHWAAIYGYGKICKTLAKHGVDTDRLDQLSHDGAFYMAKYGNFPKEAKEVTKIAKAHSPIADAEAKVIYTGHSGWVVKTKNNILVFDYWKPHASPDYPSLVNGYLTLADTDNLPVTVFTSHDHVDHYDVKALKSLKGVSDRVSYVYGFNPKKEKKPAWKKTDVEVAKAAVEKKACAMQKTETSQKAEFTHFAALKPRTQKTVNGIDIVTINSIDTGVGFLVSVDGITIFHPGDHANLTVEDEGKYFAEIDYLKAKQIPVDIAFMPVSGCPSRWKIESVKKGFVQTIQALQPKAVFPMHGLSNERKYTEFAELAASLDLGAQVLCAENPGDLFTVGMQMVRVAQK